MFVRPLLLHYYCSDLHKVRANTSAELQVLDLHLRDYLWCYLLTSTATVLLEYPKDVEVLPNEWVQFNCTITPCNYTVSWFIAGISHAIRNNDSVPGLVIRRTASMCTSNQETHFFEVQATGALNNSAFYCAANQGLQTTSTCRCGADGRCFSKPALLRGKPNIQYGFSFQFNFQIIAGDKYDSGLILLCLCSKNIAPSQTSAGTPEVTFSAHHSQSLTLKGADTGMALIG